MMTSLSHLCFKLSFTPLVPPYVGFGIPYTLLVKNVSFFVGYGSYMALFPFCIMLGGISDYEKVGISSSSYYTSTPFNAPYLISPFLHP